MAALDWFEIGIGILLGRQVIVKVSPIVYVHLNFTISKKTIIKQLATGEVQFMLVC